MIRLGRWRLELEVWRAPRAPRRAPLVLWGARPGDVQMGSIQDRERRLYQALMAEAFGMRRLLAQHQNHVHFSREWGDVAVVPWLPPDVVIVESGSALGVISDIAEDVQPLWKLSRRAPGPGPAALHAPAHGGYCS